MKAKAIPYKGNENYKFVLFFLAPLILGLLITFQSAAKAEWGPQDQLSSLSPLSQGWEELQEQDV